MGTVPCLQYRNIPSPAGKVPSMLDMHISQDLIEFQGQVLPFFQCFKQRLVFAVQFSMTRSGTARVTQSTVPGAELPSNLVLHQVFQRFWECPNSDKIDERFLGL